MKSVSKNKFLTCFRPVADIDDMLDSEAAVHPSASRRFACNPVADKHETKISATKSMFSDQKCSKFTQNQVMPQPPNRTLAKLIKAVVFETILNTRAHKKSRYSQNCFGSKRSYSAHAESSSNNGNEKSTTASLASFNTNIKEIKGLEIELSWSSSSSGSPVSESKSLSKSNKGQLEKQKNFKCLGIYMILINLVTVLCGKNSVIILTSILFCCFSLWNASSRRVKGVAELSNRGFKVQKNSHRGHSGRTG